MTDTASEQARYLLLSDEDGHGCAEASFIVLKQAFGLPDADDPSAAMALNGGVACGGNVCGVTTCRALTGFDLRAPGEHDRFVETGFWRTNCMRQVEFAVDYLERLDETAGWGSDAAPPQSD